MPPLRSAMQFARRALFAVLLVASSLAFGQPVTALWMQGDPGDPILDGQTRTFQTPTDTLDFQAFQDDGDERLRLLVNWSTSEYYTIDLHGPRFAPLAVGAYDAAWGTFSGTSASLSVTGPGVGCSVRGRFVILELVRDSGNHITSFAANFEQVCEPGTSYETKPRLFGELRINSAVLFSQARPAGWTTPDAFAFLPRELLSPSAQVVSNDITVYGINALAPISISGGEFSIDGGAFTSVSGTVSNRSRVRVRANAPAAHGTTASAILTVGGVSSSFTLSTFQPGTPFTAFGFTGGLANQYVQGDTYFASASELLIRQLPAAGVALALDAPGGDFFGLGFWRQGLSKPAVGAYEESFSYEPRGSNIVNFSGNSHGCAVTLGRFVVLDADYAMDGTVNRLAVNFQVGCYDHPTLYGEFRYNTPVPMSYMISPGDTTPDAFALIAPSPVRAGSVVTSNWVVAYGMNAAAPISVSGGEYSVNGGPFVTAPGTAQPRDEIRVRLRASRTPGTLNQATLEIGGVSATLSAQTYALGTESSGAYLHSTPGDLIGVGIGDRLLLAPYESVASYEQPFGVTKPVELTFSGKRGFSIVITFAGPDEAPLAPGIYENVEEYPIQSPGHAGMRIHWNFRNCSSAFPVHSRFVVREAVYKPNGAIERFAADFEQRCGSAPPFIGEVRFRSTVSISALRPLPVAPDFSGDAKGDLLWEHADGRQAIWLMNGLDPASGAEIISAATGWNVTHLADFDGDGKADLLWQHPDGRAAIWLMNGTTPLQMQQILNAGNEWIVTHTPDLNGDGKADLVFENGLGFNAAWTMNGTTMTSGATLPQPLGGNGWTLTKVGDFDGDGKDDLMWVRSTGAVELWTMNGVTRADYSSILGPSTGWTPGRVGDLDGDGKADIVWQHTDGRISVWLMDGIFNSSGSATLLGAGTGWQVTRLADFDGDGRMDLFFGHSDGRAAIWLMNGLVPTAQTQILNAGSGWAMKRTADMNGDGRADIVWEHTDGSVAVWLMSGATMTSGAGILGAGNGWSVSAAQ